MTEAVIDRRAAALGIERATGLRERKKAETRRALEHAALRLFGERGFEAVTIDEIAAAAGVSSRTFFRYYGSKDDVLIGPFATLEETLRSALNRRPVNEPPLSALCGAVGELAAVLERDRPVLRPRVEILLTHASLVARAHSIRESWRRLLIEEAARRLDVDPTRDLRPHVAANWALAGLTSARDVWDTGRTHRQLPDLLAEAYALMGKPDQLGV
jgi:AcrR family transcriptional regulator